MTTTTISSGQTFSNAPFAAGSVEIVPSGGYFSTSLWGAGTFTLETTAAPVPVVSSGVVLSGPVVPQAVYQLVDKGGVTVDAHVSGGSQFVFGRTTGTFVEASTSGFSEYDGHQQIEAGGRSVRTRLGEGGLQYISAGGAAFGTAIAGGSQLIDGGLAEFTTVTDGFQDVSTDGRAIDTRIGAGGTQYVEEGGLTSDTVVVNGGCQFIYSGTAVGTVVQKGGTEVVESGVVVSGLTVSSGGEVAIDGGTLVDAHLAQGAIVFQENLSSGMSASGLVVSAGFHQTVLSGATATDTTVLNGGSITFGGGTVTGLTVSSGGREYVNSGVRISGVDAGNGVELDLNSGTTARAGTVSSGGVEQVSGGTAIGTTVAGIQYVTFGGVASNTTIASGGTQDVTGSGSYRGVAIGTTVEDGGTLIAEDGSVAVGVTVESGGVLSAGFSYTISSVTVKSGGEIILLGRIGSFTVEKGGIEAVGSGGFLIASAGQVLSGVQVLAGGEVVYAGGRFAGLTISSGGTEIVSSGGVLRNVDVGDGVSLVVASGGRVSGVDVASGGGITLNRGGRVAGLTLASGASETLGSGIDFDGVTISSGLTVRVGDGATLTNAKVQSGGQVIYDGGSISGLKLAPGARVGLDTSITISSGTSNTGFTVYQAGYEDVVRGGLVSRTLVSGGGISVDGGRSVDTELIHGGNETVFSGGVARNTIVLGQNNYPIQLGHPPVVYYSELDIEHGGKAVGIAVAGDGFVRVSSGGTASRVNVNHGGTLVYAGGTVTGLKVGDGGTLEVTNLAVLSGAIVSGDRTLIVGGSVPGSAVDAVVGKGGTIIDRDGTITGLKLYGGGTEILSSGGFVSKATVVGGAQVIVSSGGGVGDSLVLGGRETVLSGGVVTGTVTFGKHGRFAIAGAPAGLTVSGFHAGDLLELSSFEHAAGEKLSFVESADKTKGVLTIAEGGMKATITLFGQYVAAGFHLATDPAGGTAISYATSASAHADLAAGHG